METYTAHYKNVYNNASSCVQLNRQLTDWFNVSLGVRPRDSLSPILFATYINNVSDKIEELDAGVEKGGQQLHMLIYADDIVLISPNHVKANS